MRGSFIHSSLDDLDLTPVEFRLLCHIMRRGVHTDSADTAAKHCGFKPRTFWRAINRLLELGLIEEVEKRHGKSTAFRAVEIPDSAPRVSNAPAPREAQVDEAPVASVAHPKGVLVPPTAHPCATSGTPPVPSVAHKGISLEGTPFKEELRTSLSAEHSVGLAGEHPEEGDIWRDIQNETTLDTLNRIAPAARLIFEDLARLKRLPYQVRLTQAKALIERVNQHGAEAVEEALNYTLARIGDLTSPFSYALARLERTQPLTPPGDASEEDREWTGADLLDLDVPLEGTWGRN